MGKAIEFPNHYKILELSSTWAQVTDHDVKLAYRRALLLHHPDRSNSTKASQPTIDQITLAYKTLLNPSTRFEYDRALAAKAHSGDITSQVSHPGLEYVDLDDLVYDEGQKVWYRSCRCGKERAYVIAEEELEESAEHGELLIGCQGCSLWLRVMFAVAEDE